VRTRLVPLLLALSVVVALAACSDDGNNDGFNAQVQNPRSASAGAFGKDLTIPKGFPIQDVPLPTSGRLASLTSKSRGRDRYYSLTYKIAARQANAIAADYRKVLTSARYKSPHPTVVTGNNGEFTTFTAIGTNWDVLVYSGRNNLRDRPRLSVDVTAHGTTIDSVPTQDDLPTLPDEPPSGSTTSTT
jgi:hypothetical protein